MYGADGLGAEGTLDNNFRLRKRRACATYGNRAAKWTATELNETLYFNKMWTWHTDTGLPEGQYSKHIYLGETRIVTKQTSHLETSYGQSDEWHHQYYYHPDHLGSAQLVTGFEGNEYQRIEYTPYGELWVEKKSEKEEGLRYLPYKFTAKEQDEETGLYYYGARYLDAKYSRWMSADPAVSDYVSGTSAGEGGIYNTVNFNLYHYAGNNPIKYTDPDGRASILQRTINDSTTNKAYHFAHKIGKATHFVPILHGLVDRGALGGFKNKNSVYKYSGSKSGFTTDDSASKTDEYIIRYTDMDDKLTDQAAKNVLASERFGSGNNEKAKKKYKIFINDCNDFTKSVLREYKKLWKEDYKQKNSDKSRFSMWKAWRNHYKDISKKKGEVYDASK